MNQPALNDNQRLEPGRIVCDGNKILVEDKHHNHYVITYISEQVSALHPDDVVLFLLTNQDVIICHKLQSIHSHLPCILPKQIDESTVRIQHECAQIDLHRDGQINLTTGKSQVQINLNGEISLHGETITLNGHEQVTLNSMFGNVSVITEGF